MITSVTMFIATEVSMNTRKKQGVKSITFRLLPETIENLKNLSVYKSYNQQAEYCLRIGILAAMGFDVRDISERDLDVIFSQVCSGK